MPPCLAITRRQTTSAVSSVLRPFLHPCSQQIRSASILGALSDTKGAYNKRIRRGRGPSSGKGKTSGRGHGGQKQHGKVPRAFNGGQSKDEVVAGRRGYSNQFSLDLAKVNLDKIQLWIDQGRLDPGKPITLIDLHRSRCTHGIKDGVKLLARNASDLRVPIHITVSRASAGAIAAIEAAGGSVTTRYYTKASIRRIIQGDTHPTLSLLSQPTDELALQISQIPHTARPSFKATLPLQSQAATMSESDALSEAAEAAEAAALPPTTESTPASDPNHAVNALYTAIRAYKYRLPDPASRRDLEYYRDPAHRGYLAYQLREKQGPSLFFKSPAELLARGPAGAKARSKAGKGGKGTSKLEGKMW